jgi:hypothetical protein
MAYNKRRRNARVNVKTKKENSEPVGKTGLILSNAFKPSKGIFYYMKNGSVFGVKPNRKGGKKGRHICK